MKRNIFNMILLFFIVAAILEPWARGHCRSDEENSGATTLVMDCAGRSVSVPVKVERIACLYAFTGHVVTMLGRGPDIVAVSYGLKRDSLLHSICPSISSALVPKAQGAINVEELLNANPDILFMPGDVATNRDDTSMLDRFKIPYLVIDYDSVDSQCRAIQIIGKSINADDRATAFIAYYQDNIKRVTRKINKAPNEASPRVYYSMNEPLRTTLFNDLATDWLRMAGCLNVALTRQQPIFEGKNYTSLEQILIWNPDIIFANEPRAADYMLQDDKWSPLKAVKESRVFRMPIGISRWGHPGSMETPLAILWGAKKLYPQRFSEIDMVAETRRFYNVFFNYSLSENQIQKILSGQMLRKPKKRSGAKK